MSNLLARLSIGVCIVMIPALASAQSVNLLSSRRATSPTTSDKSGKERKPLQIAVPAGASASLESDGGNTDLGPVLGFQLWRRDSSFLGIFFSFAPENEVKGTERDFGTFLLNPPFAGTSFTATFNKVWAPFASPAAEPTEGQWGRILTGISGRVGLTRTRWTGNVSPAGPNSTPTPKTAAGDVGYLSLAALIMSPTYQANSEGNEYQFGAELGYTIRRMVGDLAADENSDLRNAVVGTDITNFGGPEITLFARLNSAQPFVRLSRLGDQTVDGFQGWQTFFGITVLSAIFQDSFEKLEILDNSTEASPIQATAGSEFTHQLTVRGGRQPYAWAHLSGILPPGVSLSNDGKLSGKPTSLGKFRFVVQAMDTQRLQSDPKEVFVSVGK